jgi:probable HAF family extracellular repeat protein
VSRRLAALGALVVGLVVAGSAQAGAVPWEFVDLEPLKGTFSYAVDVNLAGQATGVMTDESGSAPVSRGFFYDPKTGLADIGDLGGANTSVVALNDNGVVTGTSQTDKGEVHAFLYTPGVGMRDIGAGVFPSDVSDAGMVIGRLGSNSHAFSWTDAGGFQDLGPGIVHGVGTPGTLFGSRNGSPGVFAGADFAAFVPIKTGDALDGNVFGQSVGKLSEPDGERAFVWDGDSYVMPTAPGVVSSVGQSINNAGTIAVHGTDADGNAVPLLFDPPYDSPYGSFDGSGGFTKFLDYAAVDDVGHLAGAGRLADGEVHGFVMTPYFPLQAGSAVSILLEGLDSNDPFRTMAERTLSHFSHGVSETGCFQMKQLSETLSVADGTHFTAAQRAATGDALAAVLEMGECRNALPIAPTTVPHIFSRKNERMQFTVRLVRPHRIHVIVEAPPAAKVVALNVPKKRAKERVRITLVARRLLDGGATPATVTVR